MTVAVNDALTTFLGDGSQTQFDFDFPVNTAEELAVLLDGEIVLTAEYTVNLTTSRVTFTTPPETGARGAIIRLTLLSQIVVYSRLNNSLNLAALAEQLDAIVYKVQENTRDIANAVQYDYYDPPPKLIGNFTEGDLIVKGPGDTFIPGLNVVNVVHIREIADEAIAAADAAASSETNAGNSASAANDAAADAEAARDVAIARSTGPIAPSWNGAIAYLVGDRVRHSGVIYYALQPSINVQPGTDAAYWAPDPFFQGVMKADAEASWPVGMSFWRQIAQTNGRQIAGSAMIIALGTTAPVNTDGAQWLSGSWTPKGDSAYLRYRFRFSGTVFAVGTGTLVLSMFVGSTHVGSAPVGPFAVGEYRPVTFVSGDFAVPPLASAPYTVQLRAGNHDTGGTTFWLNGNASNALFSNGMFAALEVSERVVQP